MVLSKTLEDLIERAEFEAKKTGLRGSKTRRVREGAVMGNPYIDPKATPLIDQWKVTVDHMPEGHKNVYIDHYGTQIAHIVVKKGVGRFEKAYGESMTDARALNGIAYKYGIDAGFSYRPSKAKMIYS